MVNAVEQTCPVCRAPSTRARPDLAVPRWMCPECFWHRAIPCECGTMLRKYTGAGPVDGWLCPSCDSEHADELEAVA